MNPKKERLSPSQVRFFGVAFLLVLLAYVGIVEIVAWRGAQVQQKRIAQEIRNQVENAAQARNLKRLADEKEARRKLAEKKGTKVRDREPAPLPTKIKSIPNRIARGTTGVPSLISVTGYIEDDDRSVYQGSTIYYHVIWGHVQVAGNWSVKLNAISVPPDAPLGIYNADLALPIPYQEDDRPLAPGRRYKYEFEVVALPLTNPTLKKTQTTPKQPIATNSTDRRQR